MVVADIVVNLLLESLSLLADEVKSFWGLNRQIESMYNEMKFIDIFLKSSEGKRNDPIVKEVVNQIRDIAYKAEDVVDRYTAKVSQKKCRFILKKLFHIIRHVRMLHDVNTEVGNIRSSIDEIYKNKDKYNIGEGEFISAENEASELLRKRRRNVEEEYVMHDSSIVIEELKKRHSRPHRSVVSIIGMGGLGKTTLARKIYNNDEVKQLFPLRAWGYVSNHYRPKELLLSLLMCLTSSTSEYKDFSEEQLKEEVRKCLKGKNYLIVLDDIWRNDVWDDVQDAFPDDPDMGSRILLTSRKKHVASHAQATLAYDLPFLDKEDSWKLFSKKVFREEECPANLKPLGKSIVESCRGLPLAIIVLAGLFAYKEKSQREWSRIKDQGNLHLVQDEESKVMDILKLSYDNLPPRLKPCFLYFGMYPEDYEIPVKQLIHLWIAEGFIQVTGGNSNQPEEVADGYLEQLVDLSLVQVASKRSDGGVKTCRIHDLLRKLCISESKDNKFLHICTSLSSNPRRLSCQCRRQCISLTKTYQLCIRSFILFDQKQIPVLPVLGMKVIPKTLELARVLDFGSPWILFGYSWAKLIKISKLMHLRYLSINFKYLAFGDRGDVVEDILGTGCFPNLETLHVRGLEYKSVYTYCGRLKFKRLKHLDTDVVMKLVPEHMSEPDNETTSDLQTLYSVGFYPETMSVVNKRFPKLRKLCLVADDDESGKFQSLGPLSNLRTLKIYNSLDLPSDAGAFLSNLTKITFINWLRFKSSFMNTLGQLTNLQVLKLKGGYNLYHRRNQQLGFDINCAAGEFPKLEVFKMEDIKVQRWTLERGAMPHLQCLVINDVSGNLTKLPEELWSLTTLREVQVRQPKPELNHSLQNVEVKNGCKLIIRHKGPLIRL